MRLSTLVIAAALAAASLAAQSPIPPAGVKIQAQLRSHLDTAQALAGERVQAIITKDVKVQGKKILPKGTRLAGAVLAVTPAESPKSPSHLTVIFTQAQTAASHGQPAAAFPLRAAIVQVLRAPPPPPPMFPPLPAGRTPDDASSGMGNPLDMPAAAPMPQPRPAPIRIALAGSRPSTLSSVGDMDLRPGTRLVLQVLPPPGSGGQSLLR